MAVDTNGLFTVTVAFTDIASASFRIILLKILLK